ncbi:hypothetical protein GJ699_33830, partial [Duganella sp. FT80W]
GALLLARGRARRLLWLGALGTALQLAGLALAVRWGLRGMAAAYCLSSLLTLLPLSWCALRELPLGAAALGMELFKPLAAALAMLLAVMALHAWLRAAGAGLAAAFWPCLPAGALVYGLMLLLLRARQLRGWRLLPGVRP